MGTRDGAVFAEPVNGIAFRCHTHINNSQLGFEYFGPTDILNMYSEGSLIPEKVYGWDNIYNYQNTDCWNPVDEGMPHPIQISQAYEVQYGAWSSRFSFSQPNPKGISVNWHFNPFPTFINYYGY